MHWIKIKKHKNTERSGPYAEGSERSVFKRRKKKETYLAAVVAHGAGYGSYGSYRYYVTRTGEGRNMAVFLDGYQQLRSVGLVLLWSLAADAACILLVFVLVVLLSRRAIDPVVRSAEKQKQFITDASHELKTPITVISTCLRVLEMET